MTYQPHITVGHIVRHAGNAGAAGREAAIMDVAQDLLLRHLHDVGLLDELAFKGGTSLRKLYAGQAGRFSVDLDFSVASIGTPADAVLDLLRDTVHGLHLEQFTYSITERRGKPSLVVDSPYGGAGTLEAKLDVNPPPWLEPEPRGWVPLPVHATYGGPLPRIKAVRIEENVAEKIARLNRTTTARDVYDLVWIRENYRRHHGTGIDEDLVRRLVVLKIWVDAHGLSTDGAEWKPGHEAVAFDPTIWLRERPVADYDVQDIGILTAPPPDLGDLGQRMRRGYAFLTDLDATQTQIASIEGRDRTTVIGVLRSLPGGRLAGVPLW